jgi:hypothetical protein
MVVLSGSGAARVKYSSDFKKVAKEKNIANPFFKNLFGKEKENKDDGKIKVSTEEYIKMRDEYIARRVFEEWGWDSMMWDIKTAHNHCLDFLLEELHPCEGYGGQCNLNCSLFNKKCWTLNEKKENG